MNSFEELPFDSRVLFNPPYCGLIISTFIQQFELKSNKNLPPSLLYLILPLTLDKNFSFIFSQNKRKSLFEIVENNLNLFSKLPFIIENYFEITSESIYFLAESNVLDIHDSHLVINKKFIRSSLIKNKYDFKHIKYTANILANTNDIKSIFFTLGIRL